MQILCNRFSCQKAVEVCYWSCKFRRDCKDWHGALAAEPGSDAIAGQLKQSAKKSGRVFDPQTLVMTSRSKKNRAAVVSKTPIAHLESASFSTGISTARREANDDSQREPLPINNSITHGEVKETMTEDNFDAPTAELKAEAAAEAPSKPAAPKAAKPKPAAPAKPKAVAQSSGPVFLLLYPNGKYKELRESELNTEAADVLKDPSLRLVKGLPLIPQISFKSADE